MGTLIGDGAIYPEALATMRERGGGTWAAYQNHDLSSQNVGLLKFLKYGEGCTFAEPPPSVFHWSYLIVGTVDLERGVVVPCDPAQHEAARAIVGLADVSPPIA